MLQELGLSAVDLSKYIVTKCEQAVPGVQRGQFGADMKITLTNDGPFTVFLDSAQLGM